MLILCAREQFFLVIVFSCNPRLKVIYNLNSVPPAKTVFSSISLVILIELDIIHFSCILGVFMLNLYL